MRRAGLIEVAFVLSACGAPRAQAPSGGAPESVDSYQHELDAAQGRLQAAVAGTRSSASAPATAPAPEQPAAPPMAPAPQVESEDQASAPPEREESATGCDAACRAFQSMRRAADGICELAGESDARCTHARQRVGDARQLLDKSGCSCP